MSQGGLSPRLRLCRKFFLLFLNESPHLTDLARYDGSVLNPCIVGDDLTSNGLTLLSALACRQSLVWSFDLALFSEGLGLSIIIVLIIVIIDINQLLKVDLVS